MNRRLILVAAAWFCLGPAFADAQVLQTDEVGQPIQLIPVVLYSGNTYEFRTDYTLAPIPGVPTTTPDTVLSLLNASFQALTGADGCNTPSGHSWFPSCFTHAVTTTDVYFLVMRGWTSSTPGLSNVYMRTTSSSTWNALQPAAVPFGGGVQSYNFSGSARTHLTTAHQPGNNQSHWMFIARPNEWDIEFVATSTSGVVEGLAQFDAPASDIGFYGRVIFGTVTNSQVGPVRLLKNDWFVSGEDYDGDGLGHTLEQDLGTCDRPGDTMGGGGSCMFDTCSTDPLADLCQLQLRDTDHDGLRDDVEVYGYDDVLTQMARYGADPAHQDVFVEMDFIDRENRQTITPPDTCRVPDLLGGPQDVRRLGGNITLSPDFFELVEQRFGQAPAVHNPDGLPGIRVHYDVGVANPDPTDSRWGDWGGGGDCFVRNTDYRPTGASAANFADVRRWLWRWSLDENGNGGQARPAVGIYGAGSSDTHVHELGHLLGIEHGGPWNSAVENTAGWHGGNYRPFYPSTMNYRFGGYGQGSSPGDWEDLTFSFGAWDQQLNARVTPEVSPAAGEDLLVLANTNRQDWRETLSLSRLNVDWNQDGSATGISFQGVYRDTPGGRSGRGRELHLGPEAYGSHADAAVANGVLVHAYATYASGLPQVYFKGDSDGACSLLPTTPSPSDVPRYEQCVEFGIPYDASVEAEAVAISPEVLPGGSSDGLVMVTRNGARLSTHEVDVTPNSTSVYGAGFSVSSGKLQLSWPKAAGDPVLVRAPHGGTLLVYHGSSGDLQQAYLPSGFAPSNGWSGPGTSLLSTGATFGDPGTTPGLVVYQGDVYMAASKWGALRLYRWDSSGPELTRAWTDLGAIPGGSAGLKPELYASPAPTGEVDPELHVVFGRIPVGQPPRLEYVRTSDLNNWSDRALFFDWPLTWTNYALHPLAAVYDDRVNVVPGVRAFNDRTRTCSVDSDCFSGLFSQAPNDTECISGVCAAQDQGGQWQQLSEVDFYPFATGLNPTEYCDYDDWKGIEWGLCGVLASQTEPSDSGHSPTPYDAGDRCRVRPDYREANGNPTCGGGGALTLGVQPNDRTLNPDAYLPREPEDPYSE